MTPLRCRLLGHRWQEWAAVDDRLGPFAECTRCPARKRVTCATDSPASVSPEQTPSPADDSAHRGDYVTDGEKP